MHPELATYLQQIDWLLSQIEDGLRTAPEPALRFEPAAELEANNLLAIAQHATAVTRVYALGFGCGAPVTRDRSTEFDTGTATRGSVVHAIGTLRRDLPAAFEAVEPSELAVSFVPPQHLYGLGEPRAMTPREALVESIRHLAIHLGEFRLTRSLAAASRS